MNARLPRELFADAAMEGAVRHSWDSFQRVGDCRAEHGGLRSIVEQSWRRSASLSVDQSRHQAPLTLLHGDMPEFHHTHRELLEASRPLMAEARDFLAETDTVMVLADPLGTVMDVEGDSRTMSPAEKVHLLPGASWNESFCGTNAIGTAIATGQPVQIHAQEHYCEGIKRWTCAAAVILDPGTGELRGVLDVSGLKHSYNRQFLGLVFNSAMRIQTHLAQKEWLLRYQLLERCFSRFTGTEAAIVLDRNDITFKLDDQARQSLAALGVTLEPGRPLALGQLGTRGGASQAPLPEWLDAGWIEPITEAGKRIGSIIRLPQARPTTYGGSASREARSIEAPLEFPGAVGRSVEFRNVVRRAVQLARSRASILLHGESGTGKEVFAHGIHANSPAHSGPFVALNCGGLSRELLASELFGYREGAFTGARRGGMIGKIEAAEGGTLFLDEIGEMPLDLQPSFLRVLEDGQIFRLGDNHPRKINFRLIAATHRNLRTEVTAGRFRLDLFYRISVTSLQLPALRDRRSDIAWLAEHFLQQLSRLHGIEPKPIAAEALSCLERYDWPGNIRELRNAIESALLTSSSGVIGLHDLPPELTGLPDFEANSAQSNWSPAAPSKLHGLEKAESEQIRRALEQALGNATLAARELGIAKSTLYVKLKKYGLEPYLAQARS